MARPLRIAFPGAFYHITARGNERKAVFKSKRDREKFLEYLETATERYHAVIHAYCLMDNHYHLLLETPAGNLSRIMHHVNGAYTTYFNVKRARSGHLFQGRYKAIVVEKDEYAKELSRYIHLNPVRAKMVQSPEQYAWTSYRFYIGKDKAPSWLQRQFILDYFGSPINVAQKGYEKFVLQLVDKDYKSPLKDVFGSVLLGSQAFIDCIRNEFVSKQKSDRNVPALKQLVRQATIPDICQTVESVLGETPRLSRKAKIYLCRKHTPASLALIGDRFGIGDSAVAQSCSRFLNEIKADRRLRRQVDKIEKMITMWNVET
jgi:REP element-mobilizing transposase RayT